MRNVGTAPSTDGSVTLQDIHVGTGTVTHTCYGNYPSLNVGAEYVVPISMNVTTFVNEEHELRAFNGGQMLPMRYTLAASDTCRRMSQPPAKPSKPARAVFGPNECTVTPKENAPLYSFPNGPKAGSLGGGTYGVTEGVRVNGTRWYLLESASGPASQWLSAKDLVSRSNACKF